MPKPPTRRSASSSTATPIGHAVTPGTTATATEPDRGTPTDVTDAGDLGRTRRQIALFLLWITAGVIGAPIFATIIFSGWCWLNAASCTPAATALDLLSRNMSQYVTAMIGLVGSVVGFYFGSQRT